MSLFNHWWVQGSPATLVWPRTLSRTQELSKMFNSLWHCKYNWLLSLSCHRLSVVNKPAPPKIKVFLSHLQSTKLYIMYWVSTCAKPSAAQRLISHKNPCPQYPNTSNTTHHIRNIQEWEIEFPLASHYRNQLSALQFNQFLKLYDKRIKENHCDPGLTQSPRPGPRNRNPPIPEHAQAPELKSHQSSPWHSLPYPITPAAAAPTPKTSI